MERLRQILLRCIDYLNDGDLLEVTPNTLRIRKRSLDSHERGREENRAWQALGGVSFFNLAKPAVPQ